MIRARLPWRLPAVEPRIPNDVAPADGTELVDAAPPGVGGEFDTLLDPRFPIYTASNLSEAFPGPMTPLSLELTLHAMRASSRSSAQLFGLPEPLATELLRSVAAFGHRVYGGVSILRELAAVMPGWSPEEIDQQYLGIAKPATSARARPTPRGIARGLKIGATVGMLATGFRREVDRVTARAAALTWPAEGYERLSDRELGDRIELLHDETVKAWQVSTFGTVLAGGVLSAIEKAGGRPSRAAPGARQLESMGALAGVASLVGHARTDPDVSEPLRTKPPGEALAALRSTWFGPALDEVLRSYGHRGPGETELANPMFADAPELLVEAVAKALDAPDRSPVDTTAARSRRERLLGGVAHRTMLARERSRDGVVRMTHALRLAVREEGRRLVDAGTIDAPGDVCFLTFEELRAVPPDARVLVARRRAERERLAALRMPALFELRWEPETGGTARLDPGATIDGIPAAPGTVRGPVRVLTPDTLHDLEPGEVLVANTTDTGWTPLFAFAAAVVTDVGAQISHAAVVAREYGIPCVVGTRAATQRLRTGQLVEVDGAAGTVTALD